MAAHRPSKPSELPPLNDDALVALAMAALGGVFLVHTAATRAVDATVRSKASELLEEIRRWIGQAQAVAQVPGSTRGGTAAQNLVRLIPALVFRASEPDPPLRTVVELLLAGSPARATMPPPMRSLLAEIQPAVVRALSDAMKPLPSSFVRGFVDHARQLFPHLWLPWLDPGCSTIPSKPEPRRGSVERFVQRGLRCQLALPTSQGFPSARSTQFLSDDRGNVELPTTFECQCVRAAEDAVALALLDANDHFAEARTVEEWCARVVRAGLRGFGASTAEVKNLL